MRKSVHQGFPITACDRPRTYYCLLFFSDPGVASQTSSPHNELATKLEVHSLQGKTIRWCQATFLLVLSHYYMVFDSSHLSKLKAARTPLAKSDPLSLISSEARVLHADFSANPDILPRNQVAQQSLVHKGYTFCFTDINALVHIIHRSSKLKTVQTGESLTYTVSAIWERSFGPLR